MPSAHWSSSSSSSNSSSRQRQRPPLPLLSAWALLLAAAVAAACCVRGVGGYIQDEEILGAFFSFFFRSCVCLYGVVGFECVHWGGGVGHKADCGRPTDGWGGRSNRLGGRQAGWLVG